MNGILRILYLTNDKTSEQDRGARYSYDTAVSSAFPHLQINYYYIFI